MKMNLFQASPRSEKPGVMMAVDDPRDKEGAVSENVERSGDPGGREVRLTVAAEQGGLRLDLFLAGREIGLSRSQIQRAVQQERVRVNGLSGPGEPQGEGGR